MDVFTEKVGVFTKKVGVFTEKVSGSSGSRKQRRWKKKERNALIISDHNAIKDHQVIMKAIMCKGQPAPHIVV